MDADFIKGIWGGNCVMVFFFFLYFALKIAKIFQLITHYDQLVLLGPDYEKAIDSYGF